MDESRKMRNASVGKKKEKEKEIREEYCRRVLESDGFDLEGVILPRATLEVVPASLEHCSFNVKILVNLYAKMGLHRYNMLLGGNFELLAIEKFNKKKHIPSTFYITLDAIDACTGEKKVFQVKVYEERVCYFHVRCTIARPKVTSSTISKNQHPFLGIGDQSVFSFYKDSSVSDFYKGSLPEWPSSEDAFNDTKRFYIVKKSELQTNTWIHLYLELALATKYRSFYKADVEIVKAVIETEEVVKPPKDRLNAKCAIVYIRFKNMAKEDTGKAKDCLAIVRRVFNETTGDLMLEGDTASWERGSDTDDEQLPIKRSKTEVEDHLAGFENVDVRRRSTRTPKPINRFLS